MYNDSCEDGRTRWLTPVVAVLVVAAAIAGWWLYDRSPPGPTTRSPTQNLAIVRDHSERESSRRLAADALQHAPASVVPGLILELQQGDVLGRQLAALCLGRLGAKAEGAASALTAALNDAEPRVREQAAAALGQI